MRSPARSTAGRRIRCGLFALAVLASSLGGAKAGAVDVPALVTVTTFDGSFVVRVSDPVLLAQIEGVVAGTLPQMGVIGDWVTGNGGYNRDADGTPWSWHLAESSVFLSEGALEICDGLPSTIEARVNLGSSFRRYCPWSGILGNVRADDSLPADIDVDGAVGPSDLARLEQCIDLDQPVCFDLADGCCAADIDSDEQIDCDDDALLVAGWTASGSAPGATVCAAQPIPALTAGRWLLVASLLSIGLVVRRSQRASFGEPRRAEIRSRIRRRWRGPSGR